MGTEVWYRNPHNYIRELVETGESRVAWDRGMLVKHKIDPIKHAELYFGQTFAWRLLAIGQQGSAEYNPGDDFYKPTAVYPTWQYGEDQELLEEMVEQPIGQDRSVCEDTSIPGDERPVYGQPHRIVLTELPNMISGPGRAFIVYLRTLQEDFPDCMFHLHGLYSYRVAFGMGFGAADIDPRTPAQKGKIVTPGGREERYERAQANPKWVTPLGFKPVDLAKPAERCKYNIKSAAWAAANFESLINVPQRNTRQQIDTTSSDAEHKPVEVRSPLPLTVKAKDGDKFLCDTCSLADKCSYYRSGAVCSVPGAEPKELAAFFQSRDSEVILDGLTTLVAANARRLDRGMNEERVMGDINPDVSKLLGQVFDQGTKLAKLRDPNLRGGARVQVNVGQGGQAAVGIGAMDTRRAVAGVIAQFEAQGIPRDKITPEMITNMLAGMQQPEQMQRALESAPTANGKPVIEQ